MLSKYFVMFLLMLFLSMGTVIVAQEATPPPAPPAPSGRVALALEQRVEGFELSAMQVGNTCVPPLFARYSLNMKIPEMRWAAKIADVPSNLADKLPIGGFNSLVWPFYTYSEKRELRTGLSNLFGVNKPAENAIYLLIPEFWGWSQEPSASCGPALDFWEFPVIIVGETEPGVLMGVGSTLKSANVDDDGRIRFEIVSWNPTDVLVFQERTFVVGGVEKKFTSQRVFETSGKGVFRFEIPPGWMMTNTPVKIHLRDRRSSVSLTMYLLGGDRAYVAPGGSVYNLDIPRYCAVFTGNTECSLPDETELRSRSTEETPDLQWFWELTGQKAPARR